MANVSAERKVTIYTECRLSFPAIFAPSKVDDDDTKEKYKATFLIPKTGAKHRSTLIKLREAEKAAIRDAYGNNAPPKKFRKSAIQDGDEKDYDGYAGHYFVKTSTTERPGVGKFMGKSKDGKNIIEKLDAHQSEEVYAGCYVGGQVFAACYDVKGSRGVTFYLNSIVKTRDGTPFGNRQDISQTFGEEDFDIEENSLGEDTDAVPEDEDEELDFGSEGTKEKEPFEFEEVEEDDIPF